MGGRSNGKTNLKLGRGYFLAAGVASGTVDLGSMEVGLCLAGLDIIDSRKVFLKVFFFYFCFINIEIDCGGLGAEEYKFYIEGMII